MNSVSTAIRSAFASEEINASLFPASITSIVFIGSIGKSFGPEDYHAMIQAGDWKRPFVLTLFKIYGDMLALRRGADAIPHSSLMLLLSVGMLILSSACAAALVDGMSNQNYLLTFSGYSLGLAFYASVLFFAGYPRRILQTISAIVACGALITLLYVAEYVLFKSLFGVEFASTAGILIIFWSVPVEGHIIAHAIRQHRFVGIVIAMAALILQLWFQSVFAANS